MDKLLKKISELVVEGESEDIVDAVQEALDNGCVPADILNDGLMAGMDIVGKLFADGELFVPEVLFSAEAMTAGVEIIDPLLGDSNGSSKGKIVILTAEGDLHDIGKKIVTMMLQGKGYDVVDLGIDVKNEDVVSKVKELQPDILAMSAMFTTTMSNMGKVIELLKEEGLDDVKVMVGGAPLTDAYAKSIGAHYSQDGPGATDLAAKLME